MLGDPLFSRLTVGYQRLIPPLFNEYRLTSFNPALAVQRNPSSHFIMRASTGWGSSEATYH